jgi:hypothetical protein
LGVSSLFLLGEALTLALLPEVGSVEVGTLALFGAAVAVAAGLAWTVEAGATSSENRERGSE